MPYKYLTDVVEMPKHVSVETITHSCVAHSTLSRAVIRLHADGSGERTAKRWCRFVNGYTNTGQPIAVFLPASIVRFVVDHGCYPDAEYIKVNKLRPFYGDPATKNTSPPMSRGKRILVPGKYRDNL